MTTLIRKFIVTSLLFVLAWSCAGLSFGMIGHAFSMDESSHDMATAHDCCVVNTDGADAAKTGSIDHHAPVVATLSIVDLLAVLLVAVVLTLFITVLHRSASIRSALYARIWLERLSYFALHLTQLFSRGILHPKTW